MDKKTREKLSEMSKDQKDELRCISEFIVCELCDQIDDAWQFDGCDRRTVLSAAKKLICREIDREIEKAENKI